MFIKGMPRPATAGRKMGSKNKKKVARVDQYLADKNLNPAEELLKELAQIEEPKDRAKIWLELLSYCQGKPKDFERDEDESGDLDKLDDISTEELLKIVKKPEGA